MSFDFAQTEPGRAADQSVLLQQLQESRGLLAGAKSAVPAAPRKHGELKRRFY